MAPKRTTRSTPVTPTPNATTTTTVTEAQLQALIDRGVAAAMAEAEASRVRNGVVRLTRWFEKMEYVFSISNYTASCQVKFATCTLQDDALTWWNAHVKTTTPQRYLIVSFLAIALRGHRVGGGGVTRIPAGSGIQQTVAPASISSVDVLYNSNKLLVQDPEKISIDVDISSRRVPQLKAKFHAPCECLVKLSPPNQISGGNLMKTFTLCRPEVQP
ncbi:hypothetical protein Tco_1263351 [Tanacetum coccineum]